MKEIKLNTLRLECFATTKTQFANPNSVIWIAAFFMLVVSPFEQMAHAADFHDGLKAYRTGDTQTALEQWLPLAQSGDAQAQHAIGMMHEYGRGLERSDRLALTWYQRAAEQGMPEAQYRLGVFHENGWGVSPDAQQAVHWYKRAAQLGHTFAQHDLAYMYLEGEGVPMNGIEACKWLKIASTQRPDLMEKHLSRVGKMLTSAERQTGEARALAWLKSQEI